MPRPLHSACFGLASSRPQFSAARRLTAAQGVVLSLAGTALAVILAVWPATIPMVIPLLASPAFLALATLRWACLLRWRQPASRRPRRLSDAELPVYTVLAPLHREAAILGQLVGSLAALRYPRHKLDVKLVVEAEDHETRIALARCRLPPGFDIIVVPQALPLTKPKALNSALTFARGSLLTVFDAEDVPDPGQLRLAADIFAASGPELACLQARLAFYNPHQNWLTRQFAIEYAVLFDLQLPMLSALSCAFPLGGTSNHFRTVALKRVGRWDPHNVTEDADLGFRLARHGYRCRMIAASTREEANVALANWLHQRARWLKGFLQTWLVHMRNPLRLRRELGTASFLAFQATTIGVVASALLHPVFLGFLAAEIAGGSFPPERPEFAGAFASGIGLAVLLLGYGGGMAAGLKATRIRNLGRLVVAHGHAALLAADLGCRLARPVAVPAPSPSLEQNPPWIFENCRKMCDRPRRITGRCATNRTGARPPQPWRDAHGPTERGTPPARTCQGQAEKARQRRGDHAQKGFRGAAVPRRRHCRDTLAAQPFRGDPGGRS